MRTGLTALPNCKLHAPRCSLQRTEIPRFLLAQPVFAQAWEDCPFASQEAALPAA
jgi:hypothetical protein